MVTQAFQHLESIEGRWLIADSY